MTTPEVDSGTICHHPNFRSQLLRDHRDVTVWLPPGYSSTSRYPVFYLQDGQNLFDPSLAYAGVAWDVHRSAAALIQAGEICPLILVGIANTPRRADEYGPKPRWWRSADRSCRYARFVVGELKPFVDGNYSTVTLRGGTAIGGSSLGALIAMHMCSWYPDTFGACAALSPSLWWDKQRFLRRIKAGRSWPRDTRLWLSMGDREGPMHSWEPNIRRTRDFAAALERGGLLAGHDYHYAEVVCGTHHESAWAAIFGDVLRFLFGTNVAPATTAGDRDPSDCDTNPSS